MASTVRNLICLLDRPDLSCRMYARTESTIIALDAMQCLRSDTIGFFLGSMASFLPVLLIQTTATAQWRKAWYRSSSLPVQLRGNLANHPGLTKKIRWIYDKWYYDMKSSFSYTVKCQWNVFGAGEWWRAVFIFFFESISSWVLSGWFIAVTDLWLVVISDKL